MRGVEPCPQGFECLNTLADGQAPRMTQEGCDVLYGLVSIPSLMGRLLGFGLSRRPRNSVLCLNTLADGQAPRIILNILESVFGILWSQYPR